MYKIEQLGTAVRKIILGQRGENLANEIQIDVSKWLEKCPDANFSISVIRPDEELPYLAASTLNGNILTWTPDAGDTALPGVGKMEICAVSGGRILKTPVVVTQVYDCLYDDDPSDPPEAAQGWLAQLRDTQAYVEQAVDNVSLAEQNTQEYLDESRQISESFHGIEVTEGTPVHPNTEMWVDPSKQKSVRLLEDTDVDTSLSMPGKAADAAATGEKIKQVQDSTNESFSQLKGDLEQLGHKSKNLLNFTGYEITTENEGVSFSMDDDGKIHMSGKPVGGNFVVVLYCDDIILTSGNSYTMNSTKAITNCTVYAMRKVAISGTSAEVSYPSTATSKSWTATASIINRIQISAVSGNSVSYDGYIWITDGSSATQYEPVGFISDCVKLTEIEDIENRITVLENEKIDSIYISDGKIYPIDSTDGNISFSKIKGYRFDDRDSYTVTTTMGTSGTARLYFALDEVPTNKIEIPIYLDEDNYDKIGSFGLNVRLYGPSKSMGGYATVNLTTQYKTKGWGILEACVDKMAKTSGFDMSTVKYCAIQFNANSNGDNVDNLIIGNIIVDARMKPILLLNFDGLYDSDVNANGKLALLEQYKIKSTAFELCYLPLSDTTRNAYAEMVGKGLIEIGGHACDIDQFATASDTQVNSITKYKYIKNNLDKIANQSASGIVKSWSNHRNNIPFDVFRFVKSLGCTIQRGGGNPYIHRFTKECEEVNTFALLNSGSTHTVSAMKTAIDNAIKYGCAVAISSHEVTNDTTSAMYVESCTPTQFEEFCAYVNSKVTSGELITMTFTEFYNACIN